MSYFRTCPHCGANLDPGEKCTCREDAAQGADNTQGGGAEQINDPVSASIVSETSDKIKEEILC